MARKLPRQIDTAIVGNGPSALILSYILHGHIPRYDLDSPHPDTILHEKLKACNDLLRVDIDHLTEHFDGARFSYSTQALPVNVLLDTLVRPFGETDEASRKTCITWHYDPSRIVPHVVLGNAAQAGGQWVDNPIKASWDIGSLSYAGMLSLPGYSFHEFYEEFYHQPAPSYHRPTRRDITRYLAIYPTKVGIADSFHNDQMVSKVSRYADGFRIGSHDLWCRQLVLASGIFTKMVPPRPMLRPLMNLSAREGFVSQDPVLVVGSGFSAADVIISLPPGQKIIHIYKWKPAVSSSPLRGCHQQAYPEYAGVYRKMKTAAVRAKKSGPSSNGSHPRSKTRRTSSAQFDLSRDWDSMYEGLPNTVITDVQMQADCATVTFEDESGQPFARRVSRLEYVVGRRGSLEYLTPELRGEICDSSADGQYLGSQTLREKANDDLEVAKGVFIVGSLTGDSLIRFAYGGCSYTAGKIMDRFEQPSSSSSSPSPCSSETNLTQTPSSSSSSSSSPLPLLLSSQSQSRSQSRSRSRSRSESKSKSQPQTYAYTRKGTSSPRQQEQDSIHTTPRFVPAMTGFMGHAPAPARTPAPDRERDENMAKRETQPRRFPSPPRSPSPSRHTGLTV